MAKTVKAREQYGADSFNLTIPAEISREFNVSKGDVFEVEVSKSADELAITYKRVYETD